MIDAWERAVFSNKFKVSENNFMARGRAHIKMFIHLLINSLI